MRPRTETVPKLLLEVGGRPFGFWLLERLAAQGVDEVVLCIGHLGEAIREAIGDGARFGLRVAYADEGDGRLGTAGALRHALDRLAETFVVTYGDSYLPFDYAEPLRDLCAHPEARGTMAVWRNAGRLEPSNCEVRGELVVRYEKGAAADSTLEYIDYGAMALRRDEIAALPVGRPAGLDHVQRRLAAAGLLRAHVARERFYEIGSPSGLSDLERAIATGAVATPPARS
jgi:NDP-sugar pyrophosphorylase family protein